MLSVEVVTEVTRAVWETAIGMGVEEVPDAPESEESLQVGVDISGEWTGKVVVTLPSRLAKAATAAMLECSEGDASPADVRDAVGEIANMIGGNIKSVLPGPSKLSLPHVFHEHDATRSTLRVWFDCRGERFSVLVVQGVTS